MTVKERLISLKLIEKRKKHMEYFDEIGLATNMILISRNNKEKSKLAKERR